MAEYIFNSPSDIKLIFTKNTNEELVGIEFDSGNTSNIQNVSDTGFFYEMGYFDDSNAWQIVSNSLKRSVNQSTVEMPNLLGPVTSQILSDGSTSNEIVGTALSGDGSVLIVSKNDGFPTIVIYRKDNSNNWNEEQQITMDALSDFGKAISISNDGNKIAVGEPNFNNNEGKVYIFTKINNTWTETISLTGSNSSQVGTPLSPNSKFGSSLSLNEDGTMIAIGSPNHNSNKGRVTTYAIANSLVQKYEHIDGEVSGDQYGYYSSQISLSGDGKTIAISTDLKIIVYGEGTLGFEPGGFTPILGWTSKGGQLTGNGIGISVSIDGLGNTLVSCGGSNLSDSVAIFEFNGLEWERENEPFVIQGFKCSISAIGDVVAVSDTMIDSFDSTSSQVGGVKIFTKENDTWSQKGITFEGLLQIDQAGQHMALSGDGDTLVFTTEQRNGFLPEYTVIFDVESDNLQIPLSDFSNIDKDIVFKFKADDKDFLGYIKFKKFGDGEIIKFKDLTDNTILDQIRNEFISLVFYDGDHEFLENGDSTKFTISAQNGIISECKFSPGITYPNSFTDLYFKMGYLDNLNNWVSLSESYKYSQESENSYYPDLSIYPGIENQLNSNSNFLIGENSSDFGYAFATNGEGDILAIGTPGGPNAENISPSYYGHVRVFQWKVFTQSDKDNNVYHYTTLEQSNNQVKPVLISQIYDDMSSDPFSGPFSDVEPQVGSYYWTQIGFDIDGENADDYSGESISLNNDGTIIAIGSPKNSSNSLTQSGQTRVYQWREYKSSDSGLYHHTSRIQNDNQMLPLIITAAFTVAPVVGEYYWTQMGSDLVGVNNYDFFGRSVNLNYDGSVILIGASQEEFETVAYSYGQGYVNVYKWMDFGGWVQRGNTISGEWTDMNTEAIGSQFGKYSSINDDGTIITIGGPKNDIGTGIVSKEDAGHVRVFKWEEYTQDDADELKYTYGTNTQDDIQLKPLIITDTNPLIGDYYWKQLGYDIDGEYTNDNSGFVSINGKGNILAIGSESESTYSRVYEWKEYTQNDEDNGKYHYTNQEQGDTQEKPILISKGIPPLVGNYYWSQRGFDINSPFVGSKVSLNKKGDILAMGSEVRVRIFQWREYTSVDENSNLYAWDSYDPVNKLVIITASFNYQPVIGQNYWIQLEQNINDLIVQMNETGSYLKLNGDGTKIFIGGYSQIKSKGIVYYYNISKNILGLTEEVAFKFFDNTGDIGYAKINSGLNKLTYDNIINSSDEYGDIQFWEGRTNFLEQGLATNFHISKDNDQIIDVTYYPGLTNPNTFSDLYFQMGYIDSSNKWNVISESDRTTSLTAVPYPNLISRNVTKIGLDIKGDSQGDEMGSSISLNGDGTIVAIGSPSYLNNIETENNKGKVRVYQWKYFSQSDYNSYYSNNNTQMSLLILDNEPAQPDNYYWTRIGFDIDGDFAEDFSGVSVSLNDAGDILAVGSIRPTGNQNYNYVRVFKWRKFTRVDETNNTYNYQSRLRVDNPDIKPIIITSEIEAAPEVGEYYWTQMGNNLYSSERDFYGFNLKLNGKGDVLCFSAPNLDNNSNQVATGGILIHEWNGFEWNQLGNTIYGDNDGDLLGARISMNYIGNIISVSSTLYGQNFGLVRNYSWDGSSWIQMGNDILGSSDSIPTGLSVSLNGEGDILAVMRKKTNFKRSVIVYQYNGSQWNQLGTDIDGEEEAFIVNDNASSISLNKGGNVLIVGFPESNNKRGKIVCYEWDGNSWNIFEDDILGEQNEEQSGSRVSINNNGTIVGISSPNFNQNMGQVRVGRINRLGKNDNNIMFKFIENGNVLGYTQLNSIQNSPINYNNLQNIEQIFNNFVKKDDFRGFVEQEDSQFKITVSGGEITNSEFTIGESTKQLFNNFHYELGYFDDSNPKKWMTVAESKKKETKNISSFPNLQQYINKERIGESLYDQFDSYGFGSDIALNGKGDTIIVGSKFQRIDTILSGQGGAQVFKWRYFSEEDAMNNTYRWQTREDAGETDDDLQKPMRPIILTGSFTTRPIVGNYYWTQLGNDIYGERLQSVGKHFGGSVSINDSGNIVAIGITDDVARKHVRVFEWGEYTQDDKDNETYHYSSLYQGFSENRNPNAQGPDQFKPIIISNKKITRNFFNINSIADWEYIEPVVGEYYWKQKGLDIDGEPDPNEGLTESVWFGGEVSLNNEGNKLIIGDYESRGDFGNEKGIVRIFEWRQFTQEDIINNIYHYSTRFQNSTQTKPILIFYENNNIPEVGQYYWSQVGSDIHGEDFYTKMGYSVGIDNEGLRIVVGSIGSGNVTPNVKIYLLNQTTMSWDLQKTINGENGSELGTSISLNYDGNILAMGAPKKNNNVGSVLVYKKNPFDETWSQLGNEINGVDSSDSLFGYSVSINNDGDILVIGAPGLSINQSISKTFVYKLINDNWERIETFTTNTYDGCGDSVSCSKNGNIISFSNFVDDDGTVGIHHLIKNTSSNNKEVVFKFLGYESNETLGYAKIYSSGTTPLTYNNLDNTGGGSDTGVFTYDNFQFYSGHNATNFTEFPEDLYDTNTSSNSFKLNCLLEDSLIKTILGVVKIQNLKVGDVILNEKGEGKVIKSIYKTNIDVDINNPNRDLFADKYLIKKDIVSMGVPSDNLIVSGGHIVKLGSEFHLPINSSLIENIQTESGLNKYYHIELEEYDFFMANNLPVESLCTEENEKQKHDYFKKRGLDFNNLINQ